MTAMVNEPAVAVGTVATIKVTTCRMVKKKANGKNWL
jgi:hypothetical protein